jgi:uncharacterized membrane protein
VEAACGPIGDCNTVQSSTYSRLFNVLPIGVFGLGGYVLILATWWLKRNRNNSISTLAGLILFVLTLAGTLFSLYLTYLEPFVIRAVCAWCLSSALIMTALFLLSLPQGLRALRILYKGS